MGAVVLGCLLVVVVPWHAGADSHRQVVSNPFTTQTPGAPSGLPLAIDYVNPQDPDAKPPAVQTVVQSLHPGTVIDTSVPEQCKATDAELALQGAAACPPGSQIGGGEITFDTGVPGEDFPRFVTTEVTLFNNEDELILFNEMSDTPGPPVRAVARSRIDGATITSEVPPIPAAPPPDPFLAVKRVRVTIDAVTTEAGSYLTPPPTCPEGGQWTNTVTLTYRDGVTQAVETTSPCEATDSLPSDESAGSAPEHPGGVAVQGRMEVLPVTGHWSASLPGLLAVLSVAVGLRGIRRQLLTA